MSTGSWIVVTGAASGLGRSLARAYARRGHRVALIDRNGDGLRETAAALPDGTDVECRVVDLAETHAAAGAVNALLAELDDVEVLLAVAGLDGPRTSVGEAGNVAATERVVRVNTLGAVACVDPAVAHFRRRGAGRLGVVGSVAGLRGLPGNGYAAYSASKAGIRAYVQSLQAELIRDGLSRRVSATLVLPGHFRSPMTDPNDKAVIPLERVTRDVVRAVDARRREVVVSGPMWWLQAAALRVAPVGIVARLDMGAH
ncbi:MAG: SDR family NAD(P)-dependent oxidoreductase [Kineosporiaceae bacterium]